MINKEICTICGDTGDCLCWVEIIHDECGLNIELCVCPDADIKYDHETGLYIDLRKGQHGIG